MNEHIVDVIGLRGIALKIEGRASLHALRLAGRQMIEADEPHFFEFAHAVRMIPVARFAIPDRVAVEVAAKDRAGAERGAVPLKILPKLADIWICRRGRRLRPHRDQIDRSAESHR